MKIAILMPIHDKPTPHTMVSMCHLMVEATKAGHGIMFDPAIQCSNLPNARNALLEAAYAWNADVMMSIDDDMLFKPQDVLTLCEMAEGEEDIYSGVYRYKSDVHRTIGSPCPSREEIGPLLGMELIGMGFAAIPWNGLVKMKERWPTTYREQNTGKEVFSLYEMKYSEETRSYHGEDKVFCERWLATGCKIWLHQEVCVGHVGLKVY